MTIEMTSLKRILNVQQILTHWKLLF